MEAKDLIRILQGLKPDANVIFGVGWYPDYRKQCAKAELASGDCLDYLVADRVEIYLDDGGDEENGELCKIILAQANYMDLDAAAKEYNEQIEETKQ